MNLADLAGQDPHALDDETLAAGIRDAERSIVDTPALSRRLILELKSRHSWTKVVEMVGVPQTTLHNRAYPRPPKTGEQA